MVKKGLKYIFLNKLLFFFQLGLLFLCFHESNSQSFSGPQTNLCTRCPNTEPYNYYFSAPFGTTISNIKWSIVGGGTVTWASYSYNQSIGFVCFNSSLATAVVVEAQFSNGISGTFSYPITMRSAPPIPVSIPSSSSPPALAVVIEGSTDPIETLCEGSVYKIQIKKEISSYEIAYQWEYKINDEPWYVPMLYSFPANNNTYTFSPPSLSYNPNGNKIQIRVKAIYSDCRDYSSEYVNSSSMTIESKPPTMNPVPVSKTCMNGQGGIKISGFSGGDGGMYSIKIEGYKNLDVYYPAFATNIFIKLDPGRYKYTLSNLNGACYTSEDTFSIRNESYSLLYNTPEVTQNSCTSVNDGSMSFSMATGSLGTGPYTYTLTPPTGPSTNYSNQSNSITLSNLAAGNYTISVKDIKSCNTSKTFTIGTKPSIAINPATDLIKTDITCYGKNDGTLKVRNIVGGTPSASVYTVQLLSGTEVKFTQNTTNDAANGNTATFTGIGPGKYVVKIIDSKGCFVTYLDTAASSTNKSTRFIEPPQIPIGSTAQGNLTCYNSNNGSISVQTSADATIVFSLNGTAADGTVYTNKPISKTENGFHIFSGLKASNSSGYKIMVKKGNCSNESSAFVITQPAEINAVSSSFSNVTCNGKNNGSITIKASGGVGKLTYKLTGVDFENNSVSTSLTEVQNTNVVFSNLKPSSSNGYVVSITSESNCTGPSLLFNITQPEALSWNTSPVISTINCFSSATGSLAFLAKGGTGNIIYSLSGKDYLNTSVSLNLSKPQGVAAVFENLKASDLSGYKVSVTDALGCGPFVQDNILLTQPEELKIDQSIVSDVKCFGGNSGSIRLNVSGGVAPYYISVDNGENWVEGTEVKQLLAGTYTVQLKDENSCSKTLPVTLAEPSLLSVTLLSKEDAKCNEPIGKAVVEVAGGSPPYSIQWIASNGEIISSDLTATGLMYGVYNVYVTDSKDCQATIPVVINNLGGPEAFFTNIKSTSCSNTFDGAAEIVFSSGEELVRSITWPDGSTTTKATLLAKGENTVVISTDECNYNYTVNIPSPSAIELNHSIVIHPNCYNECNGSIEVEGKGGLAPFIYTWENGQVGPKAQGLCAGSYKVIIEDQKGCTGEATLTLENPAPLEVELGGPVEQCEGQKRVLDAGNLGSSYLWTSDNGFTSTDKKIEVDKAGNYKIEITDPKGCKTSDSFQLIINNDLLKSDFLMSSEAYAGDTIVLVEISWPYGDVFKWDYAANIIPYASHGEFEEVIFPEAGEYYITLTSSLGECKSIVTKKITIYDKTDTTINYGSLGYKGPFIEAFNIFPNPTNGVFKTKVKLRESSDVVLNIYNIQENNSLAERVGKGDKLYEFEFDFLDRPAGTYLVTLKAGGEIKLLRLIIY